MTDARRKEREKKLQKLKDGTLIGKPKADFQFKIAKILERELNRLEELSALLDATPESYLKNIDLGKRTVAAMELTETLLKKLDPPQIQVNFMQTEIKATRSYDLGNDNLQLLSSDGKEMAFQIKGCSVICDLTERETEIVMRTLEHVRVIKETLTSERVKISQKEFYESILPRINNAAEKKGVKCRVGWDYTDDIRSLELMLKTAAHIEKREHLDRLYPNLKQANEMEK